MLELLLVELSTEALGGLGLLVLITLVSPIEEIIIITLLLKLCKYFGVDKQLASLWKSILNKD